MSYRKSTSSFSISDSTILKPTMPIIEKQHFERLILPSIEDTQKKKRSQNGSSETLFLSTEQTPLWHYFGSSLEPFFLKKRLKMAPFLGKNGPSLQRGAIFQNGSSQAPVWLHFFLSGIIILCLYILNYFAAILQLVLFEDTFSDRILYSCSALASGHHKGSQLDCL